VCWGREHAAADAAAAAQGAGLRVGRGDVHAHETDTLSASGSWVQWFNVFERTFVVCCCFSLPKQFLWKSYAPLPPHRCALAG
jgi:hypothetical protein